MDPADDVPAESKVFAMTEPSAKKRAAVTTRHEFSGRKAMRIGRWSLVLAGFGMILTAFAARAAVTQDSFLIRNTGDLVDLCSAPQTDPLYTAAINFCHGFGSGVVRVLQEEDAAPRSRRLFCFPNPAPTRNEAVARFVQWASADPSRLQMPAEDGIATYLSQQYPCPRGR